MVIVLLLMLLIVDTYALFETNGSGIKDLDIANWIIKVNNVNVSQSDTVTLSNFTYSTTTHTENGYFAPGMSAMFDVEIDASEAEVSVAYDLVIDDTNIEAYPNMHFSVKNMNTNETINENEYNGVILLNDSNRVVTLRIILEWDDILEYDDSDTTLNGSELEFTIDANFEQYLGE